MSTPSIGNFLGVSPVLLSAAADVAAGRSATPDYGALTYPYRKAIVIDEIRFDLRITDMADATNLGSMVYVKLQLGQNYLMRDAVPIWLLGTEMNLFEEEEVSSLLDVVNVYSHYRWRLPEPLYIEPGQILTPVFSREADGYETINARISYAGKTVAPGTPRPRVIPIPYVGRFVTTLGNTYQQSNENHLINPFHQALRVQRLTGRLLSFVSGTTAVMANGLTPATAGSSVTVQMNDSWGGKMVNDLTGPSDVWDILRKAWTVDTLMPPKGVYEVKVWNLGETQQLHVGLIGVREERT